jgi:hypothetical protein
MTITIYDLAAWKAKAERLEAENERLRAALSAIVASGANSHQNGGRYDDVVVAHTAYEQAGRVLGEAG